MARPLHPLLPMRRLPALAAALLLASCSRSAPPAGPRTDAPSDAVREAAHRLTGGPGDYDPLIELVGDSRFVLLGEAPTAPASSTASAPASRCA
ncbi:MAG: hypothetical protein ACLGI9_04490 [Thermoanaerobaculia bacterium]